MCSHCLITVGDQAPYGARNKPGAAGRGVDSPARQGKLGVHMMGWHLGEVGMRPGVIRDAVTSGRDRPGKIRVGGYVNADHGKRCGHPILVQHLQHLRSVERVRAVIDGQRDGLGNVAHVVQGTIQGVGRCGRTVSPDRVHVVPRLDSIPVVRWSAGQQSRG